MFEKCYFGGSFFFEVCVLVCVIMFLFIVEVFSGVMCILFNLLLFVFDISGVYIDFVVVIDL